MRYSVVTCLCFGDMITACICLVFDYHSDTITIYSSAALRRCIKKASSPTLDFSISEKRPCPEQVILITNTIICPLLLSANNWDQ